MKAIEIHSGDGEAGSFVAQCKRTCPGRARVKMKVRRVLELGWHGSSKGQGTFHLDRYIIGVSVCRFRQGSRHRPLVRGMRHAQERGHGT